MPQKFEYYDVNDDNYAYIYNVQWAAQTFTPTTVHNITSVKLKLFRVGNPGTLTVGIRATDGEGTPTGEDLAAGTINGNTLTTNDAGEWYEIALSSFHLSATTKYAIVPRTPDAPPDESAYVSWRFNKNDGAYSTGSRWAAYEGWWSESANDDFMFEEWGTLPAALLNPGYWHSTYWTRGYWNPLYWPRYGITAPVIQPPSILPPRRRKAKRPETIQLSDSDIYLALTAIAAYKRRHKNSQ